MRLTTLAAVCGCVVVATVSFAQTPRDNYLRLLKGLTDAGYTTAQVNRITLVATTIVDVKVCAPEEGRDERWITAVTNDALRDFGRPREELVARAQELVAPLIAVLDDDPAEKASFCGPRTPKEQKR